VERDINDDRDRDILGEDDEEFSSLDDVGAPPPENPQLDDV
jgi:hypothetical protein